MASREINRFVGDFLETVWPIPALSIIYVAATVFPAESTPRLVVVLTALLTLPGYALALVAFPLSRTDDQGGFLSIEPEGDWSLTALGSLERWLVSVGFSISLVPLYGFVIALLGLSYDIGATLTVIAVTTSLLSLVAFYRRVNLPDYAVGRTPGLPGTGGFVSTVRTLTARSTLPRGAVVFTFFVAVVSLAAVITVPAGGPTYTTVSLLTENETGDLVAAGYPHDLQPGEEAAVVFALTNHEEETVEYRVVVQSQRVEPDGTVSQRRHYDQFTTTVGADDTWQRPHELSAPMRGDRIRIAYLVYRDTPPEDPTIDNAYRSLTLWVREPMPGASQSSAANASTTLPADHTRARIDSSSPPVPAVTTDLIHVGVNRLLRPGWVTINYTPGFVHGV